MLRVAGQSQVVVALRFGSMQRFYSLGRNTSTPPATQVRRVAFPRFLAACFKSARVSRRVVLYRERTDRVATRRVLRDSDIYCIALKRDSECDAHPGPIHSSQCVVLFLPRRRSLYIRIFATRVNPKEPNRSATDEYADFLFVLAAIFCLLEVNEPKA